MRPLRRPGEHWLALGAFLCLALLFFWRLWAPNPVDRMMIGPPDGDFMRQVYPYRVFVAGAWGSAQPPLWNPHQYAGTPAWADPQQAVLYPFRLLQIPLALAGRTLPLWAVHIEALAHLALGAWFAFLLTRRLDAPPLAAAFAGISFGFGGYLTGYPVEQLAVLDTAVWVPATLWALAVAMDGGGSAVRSTAESQESGENEARAIAEGQDMGGNEAWAIAEGQDASGIEVRKDVRSRDAAPALLPAACTALAFFAGHPQTAMYAVWAGTAWLIWRTVVDRFPWRRAAVIGAVWLGGALALSAAQWLPSAELAATAARRLDPAEVAAGFAPHELLGLVAPIFARVWRSEAVWGSQWVPLYAGALALPLAAWGAWRIRAARFWVALAAAALVIGLGGHSPLYPVLVKILPGMGWFRHQERVAVLVGLGLAVAAGLALGRLMASTAGARQAARVAGALAAGAALAAALLTVRPMAPDARIVGVDPAALASALAFTALVAGMGGALLALRAAERLSPRALGFALVLLTLFDLFSVNRGNVLQVYEDVFAGNPITAALAPHARDGRVASEALLPGGPNAASVHGFFDVTGDSPLQLESMARLVEEAPEIVWWRLLGVRYAVTDRPVEDAPVREIARSDQVGLYEVQLPAPQAWVPARAVCGESKDLVVRPDFNPLETITFAPGSPGEPAACDDTAAPLVGATASLAAMDPGRAVVEAALPAVGWLVWSNAYDPGWRARAVAADGTVLQPAVVAAYGALTAVQLPAGAWTVEWTYRPNTIIVGCVLSFFALCLGAMMWRRSGRTQP